MRLLRQLVPQRVDGQVSDAEDRKSGWQPHIVMKSEEEILNYEEAAKFLKVSERTLERWTCENLIPYVRLPRRGSWAGIRFLRSQLVKWLEQRSVKPVRLQGRMSPPSP